MTTLPYVQGVFDQIFSKRGEGRVQRLTNAKLEAKASDTSSGVFKEVFVRRGRWRKSSNEAALRSYCGSSENRFVIDSDAGLRDVENFSLCKADMTTPMLTQIIGPTSECPVTPPISDDEATSQRKGVERFESLASRAMLDMTNMPEILVKNTFIEASVLEYDSLREFLKKRKIQSCPACPLKQNTAIPNFDSEAVGKMAGSPLAHDEQEEVLATNSTFEAFSLDDLQNSTPEASWESGQDIWDPRIWMEDGSIVSAAVVQYSLPVEAGQRSECLDNFSTLDAETMNKTVFDDGQPDLDDRLQSLRIKGSAIQLKLAEATVQDDCWAMGIQEGADRVGSFEQWADEINMPEIAEICRMPDVLCSGAEALLKCEGFQQQGCSLQSLHAVLVDDASAVQEISVIPPPPPPPTIHGASVAPPILRLAEAIAPPELGGPKLPSIGSLLHHRRECKPCTFFHTRGCENKSDCKFCHLCGPGEKKKRLKAMKAAQKEATLEALENAKAMLASYRAAEEQAIDADMIIE